MPKRDAPFRNGQNSKQGGRGRFTGEDHGFNNDYYASNKNGNEHASSSSSARDAFEGHKFGKNGIQVGNTYENGASQMSMKRNDSDFNIQRSVPTKKTNKYNSLDRGSGVIDENDMSPLMMKKKANVHLQPMSHKKAQML